MTGTFEITLTLDTAAVGATTGEIVDLIKQEARTDQSFTRRLVDFLINAGFELTADSSVKAQGNVHVSHYAGPVDSRRGVELILKINEPNTQIREQLVTKLGTIHGVTNVKRDDLPPARPLMGHHLPVAAAHGSAISPP